MKEFDENNARDRAERSPSSSAAGAGATSPAQIPPKGWWNVIKRTAAGFADDRVMTEAAGVTFYVLLSLFPALAAFISIYGLFNNASTLGGQLAGLGGIVPGGGIDIIKDQITALTAEGHKALGFASLVGLAISLWSANSGVKSLFDALNTIYHEHEKRSFLRRTLISFGFTLGIIGFVIIALCAVVAVPIALNFIGLGNISKFMFGILRWPFMLIVIIIGLAFVYRYGPSRNPARWQWVSWGSAIAAVSWISASLVFSYYVANFGSYNKTYGSLGAVVGFMTWIWISSIVVLMGAELNAELEQQTKRDSTIGPEKPKGTRGAYRADVKSDVKSGD
jgi:membrane protein